MDKRLFDEDPATGTKEYFHYDDDSDTFTIETQQDVSGLVDANRQLYNDSSSNWNGDVHRVASIPMNVYMDLQRRGILDDQAAFKRWLNNPDNRYFRTRPGKV